VATDTRRQAFARYELRREHIDARKSWSAFVDIRTSLRRERIAQAEAHVQRIAFQLTARRNRPR
jgi:hypothetical protein